MAPGTAAAERLDPVRPGRDAGLWPGVVLLDLDGVVYTGDTATPGAVASIETACEHDVPIRYITNNAFRTRRQVAERLRRLGVAADPNEVITSSGVAADLLASRREAGAIEQGPVSVVGGPGLTGPLTDAGFEVAQARHHGSGRPLPAALVQGFTPELTWQDLAAAAYLVRAGVWWLATNLDSTLPTDSGPAPGNGALVVAVSTAAGRPPDAVAGKPATAMFALAARDAGVADMADVFVVGDRLDTDIAGAVAVGCPSMLVLTGVHGVADAAAAAPGQRPTFLGNGLAALTSDHPPGLVEEAGRASCRRARAEVRLRPDGAVVTCTASGDGGDGGLDVARALLWAAWSAVDELAADARVTARRALSYHPVVRDLDRATRAAAGQAR